MSGTGQLPELESLRMQLADVARELAERDRTLQEQTIHRDHRLQDLQEQSVLLRTLVEGTAAETGEQFFASLVNQLSSVLQVQYAVIGTVTETAPRTIHTLAVSSGGTLVGNFEYPLSQTPCETALTESFATFDSQVQDTFPNFELLAGLRVDSYCGVPIRINDGVVIGILAIMDTKPLRNSEWLRSVLTLFASRTGAEIQRLRAERTQQQAERRLRFTQFAVDHSFDGVLWADDSTQFIYANDAACRSLGYSREELLGLTIADIAPRHDPDGFQQRLDRIKQGGAAIYESVHRRKDGTEFPVEVSVTYLEYEGKGYTCGIIRDITERQRVEQERLQALADLRNITETVPDFMFTLDTQGNMVKWNRRVEEVTGYSSEELHNASALTFVPAHEQEQTALAIQRAFTDGKAELEGHLLTKDQRTIPYHWTGAVLKDPQGRIIGITGIGRDVSEQKQAAESLQRQHHRLLEAQALAHLGSWEWDIESGETDWSEEQFRIFGYEPGTIAVTYDTFLAAILPDDHDRVLAAVNDALLGKCPLDVEGRIVRPNGDIRVIHMRADVQRDATGHPIGMAGTILDITERKKTEEALRASEERWYLAVQGSNDGIWDWSIQTGAVFFSPRWKAMRGFEDQEVSNHIDEWRSRIHPDDLDRVLQSIDHYLAKQTSAFIEEYRVQRKDGSYMWVLDRGVALWAEDGTPVRMAGSETDITDRKRTETILRHRLEFERLIASLSTHFINLSSEDIDSGITHALRSLAEFSHVDRSYVFMFRDQGRIVDNTHEWCADGITPQIDQLQALPVDAFPWIMARHQRGEIIQLSRMKDLPAEARAEREEFEREEIRSLLTLPLVGARGVIGFLGFDMVREERHWEAEDIALLKLVGEMFANAIERKQTEEALRKSVDRFDLGAQGSRDGLWYAERVSDNLFAPHNPIYYSPRMKEIMGVNNEVMPDVLGTWLSLVHPDDLPTVLVALTQHLEQHLPYDVEYRILQQGTGTLRWIGAKGQAVWDSSGTPIRMAGSFSDITERKRAEEALRTSQEKLQQALRASHTGLWDWNTDTNETSFSREWKHQLGYEETELADMFESWESLLHPEDHDRVIAYVRAYLANPEGDYQQEFRLQHKDGTYRWIEARAAFVTEPEGRRVRLLGSHTDITERKQAELALRDSEARTRSILETALDAIISIDGRGQIIGWNSRAEVMFGHSPHEALGRSLDATIIPARYRQAHAHGMNRMLQSSDTSAMRRRFEFFALHRDGHEFPVEFAIAASQVDGQPMFTAFIRDISERKQAEAALKESEERYRTLVELSPSGVFVFSEGRTVYVNSTAVAILGATGPSDILERSPFAFIHPNYHDDVTNNLRRVLAGKTTVHRAERVYLKMDGTPIHVQVEAVRITWNGKPAIQGFFSDITERKRAEETLRQSEARFRTAFEKAAVGMYLCGLDGRMQQVNPAFCRILGYSESELLALDFQSITHPDDLRLNLPRIEQLVKGELPTLFIEKRHVHKNGRFIWVHASVSVLYDQSQQPVQLLVMVQDITDRKQAEESDQASRELLEAVGRIQSLYIEQQTPAVYFDLVLQEILTASQSEYGFIGEVLYDDSLRPYLKSTALSNIAWNEETKRLFQEQAPNLTFRNLDTLFGAVLTTGNVVIANDPARDPRRGGLPSGHPPLDAFLGLPLYQGTTLVGMIGLANRPGGYSEMLVDALSPLLVACGGIVGSYKNQQQRMHAETALATSERQLRTVLNALPVGVWFTDEKGHVLYGNPVGHHIWAEAARIGLPQTGGDGLWWETIAQPEGPHRWAAGMVLARGHDVRNEMLAIETRAGERRTILNSAIPVKGDAGEILGAIVLNEDITDRVRAENALHQEHALLMAVMDAATDIIFVKDLEGRYIHINRAGAQTLGMPVEDVLGWNDYALWPSDLAASCQLADRRVFETGEAVTVEETSVGDDGKTTIYLTTKAPYRNSDGHIIGVIGVARDITERKQAEEALRASEERFAKAFRSSPYPIVISELDSGLFIDANDAAYQAFGYQREGVANRTSTELGLWPTPDHRTRFVEALRRTGAIRNLEIDLRMRNGELRHCLVSAEQIELHGKHCMVTVGTDITEQKRAEEALHEQHALLSAIMNTTMDIIFVKDLQGHYLHMNPAGARVVGLSPQEVIGKDDDAIWPADLAACCKEADRQVLSTGCALTMEESTLAHGTRITYLTTKAPYRDAAGNTIGIIGVAHDISQIKQSEENLRRSHAFIRQVIDTDPNFIFAKDRNGRFTLVNKAVADAYGTTVDNLIGKTDADFNQNMEEVADFLRRDRSVIENLQEQFIPEERITDATGTIRWLQTVIRPILDESGQATMVLGAATDITERKRMEEALRQRERDLRAAIDERERISQDLHDGILQSLYAVGLGLEACKPLMTQRHYKKAVATMSEAIGQLNHVMSEVRNFIAGLESQVLQGSTFPAALQEMVTTLAATHPLRCTVSVDETAVSHISTQQALHLLNIVREALSNSLRHAQATKATVSLKPLSRSIRLSIVDNGIGFEPTSMRGVGHGLTNMAARARKVGGRFAIKSVPQRGTRITIDLPKEHSDAESKSPLDSTAARR